MPGCKSKMTQYHIFYCNLIEQNEVLLDLISYEDLFQENTDKQYSVMIIFFQRLEIVKKTKDKLSSAMISFGW